MCFETGYNTTHLHVFACVQLSMFLSYQCENIPLESEGMLKKATKFSDLYVKLPSRVSSTTAKNLSVPICVVCLLHLANEKVSCIMQIQNCIAHSILVYIL